MPEGDTIFRTAATLDRWLRGREVTAARTTVDRLPAARLVGQTVEAVEARAKHLLIRFSGGQVLHTHMQMTGAWHVYRAGERWQRPASQARFVLEASDHLAVCFRAPVVELLAPRGDERHPALAGLGPDVMQPPVDLDQVRSRAQHLPPGTTIGELLLDQRVVSGIGNIWRCEALFARRVHPWLPWTDLAPDDLDAIVVAASNSMRAPTHPRPQVYRRTGRPCPRCGTRIAAGDIGTPARRGYWCPRCQAPVTGR